MARAMGVINKVDNSSEPEEVTALPPLGAQQPRSENPLAPYIDNITPINVIAPVGKCAYLSCSVRNLGNKTVSWIRHRDIHILTVGSYTYTSDQRFQTTHHQDTEDWTLQIKWSQKRDEGIYECQISSQPITSYFVYLRIVDPLVDEQEPAVYSCTPTPSEDIYNKMFADTVPAANIIGGPDMYVDMGSTINLTCTVRFCPENPAYIFWYHGEEVISYDSNRGGVSVLTEKGELTTSHLLIQDAKPSDSGKYSCSPSNADVASIQVHVLAGENPAAMQTGASTLTTNLLRISVIIFGCSLYSLVFFAGMRYGQYTMSNNSR